MTIYDLQEACNDAHPINFRPIQYGRPDAVSPAAAYAEWHPEYGEEREFDVEVWEASACAFWFTDRLSFRYAYSILRAFRKANTVTLRQWPEGLALGQIGAGKQLVIIG